MSFGPLDKGVYLFSEGNEIYKCGDLVVNTQDMVIGLIAYLTKGPHEIISVELKVYQSPIINMEEAMNVQISSYDRFHCYSNHIRRLTTEEEFLYHIHGAYVLRAE